MKRRTLLLALTVVLLGAGVALAQSGGGYDLSWHTVDGGGGNASGGTFTLVGTVGQPEPGPALSGGTFVLYSGFWPGGGQLTPPLEKRAFLPLILANY